ncbi:MAG: response regulator transcription factor [Verrucomicrobiaceae bacterium]|nr:response regulator transcription factor [Verrucomicrobiaceae bacterium]
MKKPQTSSPASPDQKKIVIVEDHTLMREGLTQLVNSQPDLHVVAEASDAAKGLNAILEHRPDVAIVDITLPGRNGLELIKDIRAQLPEQAILVSSMHDETLYAERTLKAGAKGYIMKDADRGSFIDAIRQIIAGGYYVSERMSAEIFAAFTGDSKQVKGSVNRLSDREFEVFELLGLGLGTNEIAQRLGISPKTVEVHRAHIREKLEMPTGAAVVRYAVRWTETRNLGA